MWPYYLKKSLALDVLINNAGVGITGPLEETPIEEIQKAFATNLYGPIQITNAGITYYAKTKGWPYYKYYFYCRVYGLALIEVFTSATKAALEITTEAYRMELMQFGIQMSNVAPGDFATNIAAGRYHAPHKRELSL